MTYPKIKRTDIVRGVPSVTVENIGDFSVFKTFDCGQCFRFDLAPGGSEKNSEAAGIAFGRKVIFSQKGDELTITGTDEKDYRDIWYRYLSFDTDYDEINRQVTSCLDPAGNEVMKKALSLSRGIRILRQDRGEALISFIISQNNNIPRIKKIISSLCDSLGDAIPGCTEKAFPSYEKILSAGEEFIFGLKTGFRARYIIDAAEKVLGGDVRFDRVSGAASYEEAESELMKITGVGRKVAACALLFGFGRGDAFPVDVWIKKIMTKYFPQGLEYGKFGNNAGIAQQYLFYMERYCAE